MAYIQRGGTCVVEAQEDTGVNGHGLRAGGGWPSASPFSRFLNGRDVEAFTPAAMFRLVAPAATTQPVQLILPPAVEEVVWVRGDGTLAVELWREDYGRSVAAQEQWRQDMSTGDAACLKRLRAQGTQVGATYTISRPRRRLNTFPEAAREQEGRVCPDATVIRMYPDVHAKGPQLAGCFRVVTWTPAFRARGAAAVPGVPEEHPGAVAQEESETLLLVRAGTWLGQAAAAEAWYGEEEQELAMEEECAAYRVFHSGGAGDAGDATRDLLLATPRTQAMATRLRLRAASAAVPLTLILMESMGPMVMLHTIPPPLFLHSAVLHVRLPPRHEEGKREADSGRRMVRVQVQVSRNIAVDPGRAEASGPPTAWDSELHQCSMLLPFVPLAGSDVDGSVTVPWSNLPWAWVPAALKGGMPHGALGRAFFPCRNTEEVTVALGEEGGRIHAVTPRVVHAVPTVLRPLALRSAGGNGGGDAEEEAWGDEEDEW